jgi:hypothetical protein
MASYTIKSVDPSGALVAINFDHTEFDDYDEEGNETKTKTQEFKFYGLRTDTREQFEADLQIAVQNKVAEIEPPEVPEDIQSLVDGDSREITDAAKSEETATDQDESS